LRGRPHQMPGVVVQLHVDEDVAREELPRRDLRLSLHELLHLLGRNQNLAEVLLLTERLHALLEGGLRLLLGARVGMNNVPLLRHSGHGRSVGYETRGASSLWMMCDRLKSTSPRNRAKTITTTTTTIVAARVSFQLGQWTFFSSIQT